MGSKDSEVSGARRIEYVPVSALKSAKRNPKRHDQKHLQKSFGRFGYTEPVVVDERTGLLVAGHGRVDGVRTLQAKGEAPPEGIKVTEAGEWCVPVVRGWASRSDDDAEAYIIASNQLTISGGWDDDALEAMLKDLNEAEALEGVGFDDEELEELLKDAAVADGADYTQKIEAPIYRPTGPKPAVSDLYSAAKAHELELAIMADPDITDQERAYLVAAAQRHVVFNYQNAAEYYAHATAPMQRLMEQSALVIIDFDKAVEHGFVKLSEGLAADFANEGHDE